VLAFVLIAVYHGLYATGGMSRKAFPFFGAFSALVLAAFTVQHPADLTVPLMMITLLGQLALSYAMKLSKDAKAAIAIYVFIFLSVLTLGVKASPSIAWSWYLLGVIAIYWLYHATGKQYLSWMGLGVFTMLLALADGEQLLCLLCVTALAAGIFALSNTQKLSVNHFVRFMWYLFTLWLMSATFSKMAALIPDQPGAQIQLSYIMRVILNFVLIVLNFYYYHTVRKKSEKLDGYTIAVMVVQGFSLFACLWNIAFKFWLTSLLGVVGSLMILSHSLPQSFSKESKNKDLMLWQFIKFTLYCFTVPQLLNWHGVVAHVLLLVIAICAVWLGFRMNRKSIRIYGLVLALVDVVALVLCEIDYSSSIQLSLGVIVCGLLCFGISFLYSRLAQSANESESE
jgi:hypothetical protein